MNAVGTIISVICKATNVLAAAVDIGEKLTSEKPLTTQDKVHIALSGIFCGLQVVDFTFMGVSKLTPNAARQITGSALNVERVQFALAAACGVSDVARTVSQKVAAETPWSITDVANAFAVLIFRLGDATQQLQDFTEVSEALKKRLEDTKPAMDILTASFMIVKNRHQLGSAGGAIIDFIRRRFCEAPGVNQAAPAIITGVANAEEFERQSAFELFEMAQGTNLTKIPRRLWIDNKLALFRCKITGAPVRFAVTPSRSTNGAIYERETLKQWMQKHPGELPPDWPSDLPCIKENVIAQQHCQQRIDETLNTIADEAKDRLTSFNPLQKCLTILSNLDVTKTIKELLPTQSKTNVLVQKIKSFLFKEGVSLPARHITLTHNGQRGPIPLIEKQFFASKVFSKFTDELASLLWNHRKVSVIFSEDGVYHKVVGL